MQKEYRCECGKVYTNPQSFNGHKSHCKVHLSATGRLNIREDVDASNAKKFRDIRNQRAKAKTDKWVAEQHRCEKCGKIMTHKFGSGRFCSYSCSNSHISTPESRENISCGWKKNNIDSGRVLKKRQARIDSYNINPKKCVVCGAPLSYTMRLRKTCSDICARKLIGTKSSASAAKKGGNNNINGVRGTARYGTYNGFHCDSSYELAFVIYCIDHEIDVVKNHTGFDYIFEGKCSKYYPDFIVNNTYVEIKNYWTPRVQAKIEGFPKDLRYQILYYDDIKPCIDYCISKYGNDFTTLYDRSHPSWMDKHTESESE